MLQGEGWYAYLVTSSHELDQHPVKHIHFAT